MKRVFTPPLMILGAVRALTALLQCLMVVMEMFAVIKTGGKQYKVAEGDIIRVEKLAGEAGAKLTLEEVLLVSGDGNTTVGTPLVAGAAVQAEVIAQDRGPEDYCLQEKAPPDLPSQKWPPPGSDGPKNHRHHGSLIGPFGRL